MSKVDLPLEGDKIDLFTLNMNIMKRYCQHKETLLIDWGIMIIKNYDNTYLMCQNPLIITTDLCA